jgi:SH3 domain protein
MKRLCLYSVAIVFLSTIMPFQTSLADTIYVKSSEEAPLRSGPSTRNKIVAKLPPGAAVEILKKDEWTRVRFNEPEGKVKEGWVESRYLVEELARELENENSALKEQFAASEKEKSELSQKEKLLTDKLTKLETEYESLKSGSANYIQIRDEYDTTKTALTSAEEEVKRLVEENQNLRFSQNVKWFAAGATVLLGGWFIGWIMGRHQKKRRRSYLM